MNYPETSAMSVLSPAKLNLFLHITGQRDDGYHNLQTVFQLLEYGDDMQFSVRDDGKILLEPNLEGIPTEQNLAVRAARLLQQVSGVSSGANIKITKRIPMGAGLGGGSSNAATTLLVLNQLWNTNLDQQQLCELGLQLGADVPVFVGGRSAWAEGIGEQLTPVDLPEKWFLVIVPDCHVSTAEIFGAQELTRNTSPITIAAFLQGGGQNDCQKTVINRHSEVADAIEWLSRFTDCQMTGSGSAIFASFTDQAQAEVILEQLPEDVTGFVARGVNLSPAMNTA
jgi:4-diphosphocytidyl-2-C-methyl-D-erythritol kinase